MNERGPYKYNSYMKNDLYLTAEAKRSFASVIMSLSQTWFLALIC